MFFFVFASTFRLYYIIYRASLFIRGGGVQSAILFCSYLLILGRFDQIALTNVCLFGHLPCSSFYLKLLMVL